VLLVPALSFALCLLATPVGAPVSPAIQLVAAGWGAETARRPVRWPAWPSCRHLGRVGLLLLLPGGVATC